MGSAALELAKVDTKLCRQFLGAGLAATRRSSGLCWYNCGRRCHWRCRSCRSDCGNRCGGCSLGIRCCWVWGQGQVQPAQHLSLGLGIGDLRLGFHDQADRFSSRSRAAGRHRYGGEIIVLEGLDIHIGLVRLNHQHRFPSTDLVARLLQPFDNLPSVMVELRAGMKMSVVAKTVSSRQIWGFYGLDDT